MNRFKREIKKRGYKLACDYICMPFYPEDLQAIFVDSQNVTVTYIYLSIIEKITFNRDMSEKEEM